jgi:lipoic acid synthetase
VKSDLPAYAPPAPAPAPARASRLERPEWLKVRLNTTGEYDEVRRMMRRLSLVTVCEEARCPNIHECWARERTATFMLMGDICTRHCGFCAVGKGRPGTLDPQEPERVAEAAAELALSHAVVTSVNRDDLPDGGAAHFARTIRAIRRRSPSCTVEVLIPDFQGDAAALDLVLDEAPEILNHNMETVARLYRRVRPDAGYAQSLDLISRAARRRDREGLALRTKSGLMVGLGETEEEVVHLLADLRAAGCDIATIGQYLQPHERRLPIERYYTPEEFERLRREGEAMGFVRVESGPLVRSSYHARRALEGPVA